MVKFVTFGETMVQYNATYTGPFMEDGVYILDCAGAESNVAVNLGKLGLPGLETVWVSRLGDDEGGRFILRELAGRTKVEARLYEGHRTGVSYLNHLEGDEHVKTYRRKGSAASYLTFRDVEPHLRGADLLHVTGITPALSRSCHETVLESLRYSRENDVPVSFDVNYRPQLWEPAEARPVFEQMAVSSTIVKLGYDEARVVWGKDWSPRDYAEHLHRGDDRLVVVTLGPDGAVAFDGDNLVEHPGYRVEVVDPVGAGDAFVAGFLAGLLRECGVPDVLRLDADKRKRLLARSLEIANVCGALTCTRRGDTIAMPDMGEVLAFIRENGHGTRGTVSRF